MKYALVSPDETVTTYDGQTGWRVAETVLTRVENFPVAAPLFWAECDDACLADQWFYVNNQIIPIPKKPIPT